MSYVERTELVRGLGLANPFIHSPPDHTRTSQRAGLAGSGAVF